MNVVISTLVIRNSSNTDIKNLVTFSQETLNLLRVGLARILQCNSIDQPTNNEKILLLVYVTQIASFVLKIRTRFKYSKTFRSHPFNGAFIPFVIVVEHSTLCFDLDFALFISFT